MIQIPQVIKENPFRILGLYSNSGVREQSLNAVKITRYAAVGKTVTFPTDLSTILGDVNRTPDSVDEASRKIQLNSERVAFAMFWMMRDDLSTAEEEALGVLFNGDLDRALSLFEMLNTPSAIINTSFIYLLKGNLKESISAAWRIISSDHLRKHFLESVCGDLLVLNQEELAKKYIEVLKTEFSVQGIYTAIVKDSELTVMADMLANDLGKGIQAKITARVSASRSGNDTAEEWCAAGIALIDDTKEALAELDEVTLDGGLEKRLYADKVATQALQCVINAYNIAFEQVSKDNGSLLQGIIPQCLDIINRIDTTQLSRVVVERIKSNKEGIEKIAKEGVQKLVLYAIANDTSKCFFCGASTSKTRTFFFTKQVTTRVSFNKEKVTTYTKTLDVPTCQECNKSFDKKDDWRQTVTWVFAAITFITASILFSIFGEIGFLRVLVLMVVFGFGFSYLAGMIFSYIFSRPLQWIFDRKSIRRPARTISDHPATKEIYRQGYSLL